MPSNKQIKLLKKYVTSAYICLQIQPFQSLFHWNLGIVLSYFNFTNFILKSFILIVSLVDSLCILRFSNNHQRVRCFSNQVPLLLGGSLSTSGDPFFSPRSSRVHIFRLIVPIFFLSYFSIYDLHALLGLKLNPDLKWNSAAQSSLSNLDKIQKHLFGLVGDCFYLTTVFRQTEHCYHLATIVIFREAVQTILSFISPDLHSQDPPYHV